MPEDSWLIPLEKTQIDWGMEEQRFCALLPGENSVGDKASWIVPGLCGKSLVTEVAAWYV